MPWSELASTKLSTSVVWCGNAGAAAPPNCVPTNLGGSGGPNSTIDAWVTGALRTSTGQFIFPAGGGHADWPGNQVIGFTPGTGWALRRPHYASFPALSATNTYFYAAGEPASKHTYDSIVYMPAPYDKFWCGAGIYWSPGGNSTPAVCWWYDPNTETFTEKAIRPGGYGIGSGWDSVGQRVLFRTSSLFVQYDPSMEQSGANAAAYTTLFTQTAGTALYSSPLAIDAVGRKVYRLERRNASNPGGGLKMVDLNALSAKEVLLASTGDLQIETENSPGLIYADGRLIAFGPSVLQANKGAVYTAIVDGRGGAGQPPVQWIRDPVGTEPDYVSANNDQATSASHGTWKKFFGPVSTKYYYINQWNQNVWEYTPSWSSSSITTYDAVTDLTVEVI